ncbi:MAG: efflux RND transporter permease subunit [Nostocaceae cyanobacterium]|nr:efflux RND transporter permease subunit [Nostocaceae cyanobacterium]
MFKPNLQKSSREQFNISKLAIRYSWLTISFWIAIAVAGILAFSSLKYALFPDITFPVVVVNATAPLTTALDTEAKLTQPIEQGLNSLAGLDDIRSSTYPGQSVVSLSFDVGTNLEASTQEVETVLKQTKLTQGASFKIIPLNLNESAVISYAIESSSQSLTELSKLTQDQIVPAINKLPGVEKVTLLGTPVSSQIPTNANNTANLTQQGATLVRLNGENAIAIQVVKQGEANTLEVVNGVEKEIAKLRSSLEDVKITIAATQADYIRKATHSTIDALLQAIVLAVLVIFPFLRNWQATLISALAIPISLLATFIVMALFGFNLETITLLALALVIGIMVDDAIVDVENIMRHIENGENPRQAAILGTTEIGLTVTAATFTAVSVFLPIGLMGGVIGQFFKPFGITVCAAMLASLLVARTLSPVLSSYWLKPASSRSLHSSGRLWGGFAQIYHNLLAWSVGHRWLVMALAGLILVASILLIPMIPKGFIPKLDRGEFNITYTAPLPKFSQQQIDPSNISPSNIPNPLQDSLTVAKSLEEEVRKSPAVEKVFTVVGSREGEPNKGTIYVKLKSERTIKTSELQDQLRSSLPVLPGVTTSVEDIQFVDTGSEKPLQIALQGNDLKALSTAANTIKNQIEKLPGIADVSLTGTSKEKEPIFQIQRQNQQRVAYIGANLGQELTLGDATDKVVAIAKDILPPNITLDLGGDSARSGEVFGSFGSTLLLSALCILGVLLLLFRNWSDPIVIVTSLPLALIGALLALLITKSDFGMISLIGFVFLLGLSNKNDIIMVDYINQLRRSGLESKQAILQAGSVRLRPIIMTTASTILGMMPIALGLGAGSELRSPMAVAIAGGLVSSTILSLILIPVVYSILDDWFNREQGIGNS